ncbi:MAG: zf-TFIIB domain-containing protein [Thermodesulfovibrionales bacterium]|jgi:hypothetical protein
MKCPVCNTDLLMSERQGIEIDYCPQCRGVWLDRGELDKIIERSAPAPYEPPREQYPSHGDSHYKGHDDYRKHKKKSFFEELFD